VRYNGTWTLYETSVLPEQTEQTAPSAIVIGARTQRQGTGPFIAAGLANAGIGVSGIVGTSEASVAQAQRQLAENWGLQTAGFTNLEAALETTGATAVAICSPWQVHQQQLTEVAAANRHCLVEKPLAWPLDETGADQLIAGFEQRGLLLQVVNQWPTTLGAYAELHGDPGKTAEQFTMRLSPISIGPDMITDSAPHFIGMLQSLAGPGNCTDSSINSISREELHLDCRYQHARGAIAARLILKTRVQRPRPAWYEINGRRADREVALPDYRQYLVSGDRRVKVSDPMQAVAARFARDLRAGEKTQGELLRAAHRNLLQLAAAWDR
jgi:GFO/IDH/MocA oxidoreductase family protein